MQQIMHNIVCESVFIINWLKEGKRDHLLKAVPHNIFHSLVLAARVNMPLCHPKMNQLINIIVVAFWKQAAI
jgi:hypothetical protein